jgi:integrase
MAHFRDIKKDGKVRGTQLIYKRNGQVFYKTFIGPNHRKTAEEQARAFDTEYDRTLLPPSIIDLQKKTVADLIDKYIEDFNPPKNTLGYLKRLKEHPLGSMSLADRRLVNAAHAFLDERCKSKFQGKGWKKAKPIQLSSVKREYNVYCAMFNEARRAQWFGLPNIPNPFKGYEFRGPTDVHRTRRLVPGELEKIEAAFEGLRGPNRYYVPLAFYITIETGMHEQEIFNLTQKDVNLNTRRIRIRKHKNDKKTGRKGITIVMPLMVAHLLEHLQARLIFANSKAAEPGPPDSDGLMPFFKNDSLIFPPPPPMKANDFKQAETYQTAFSGAFDGVLERSGINKGVEEREDRLCFADLRHEAANRMRKAGLVEEERALMLGHKDKKNMPRRYAHDEEELREDIQRKLDAYVLQGRPEYEFEDLLPASIKKFLLDHEPVEVRARRIERELEARDRASAVRQAQARVLGAKMGGSEASIAEHVDRYDQAVEARKPDLRSSKLTDDYQLSPELERLWCSAGLESKTLGELEAKYSIEALAYALGLEKLGLENRLVDVKEYPRIQKAGLPLAKEVSEILKPLGFKLYLTQKEFNAAWMERKRKH